MIAAVLAGVLATSVLAAVRIRPDHRLRDIASRPAPLPAPIGRSRRIVLPPFRRRRSTTPADLATWCDALARELRSGASLSTALCRHEPPPGSALDEVRRQLERGVPLSSALVVPAPSPDEQAVLTVLAACAHHGGPAAQPLDRVAGTLRRRAADDAERAVHSAQARASAMVMTVLPGAVFALLLVTSSPVRAVATTRLGVIVIAAGLLLNAVGWSWMRRIISGGRR